METGFPFFIFKRIETSIQQAKGENMKSLKRLGAAVTLTFALALTTFGDCVPPAPGEIQTPPCAVAQIAPDDSTGSEETHAPAASNAENVFTVSKTTICVLLSALSIF